MSNLIQFKEKKPKVGIIIQARMTSTRFPGKSMALLNGKPVLQRVIESALKIRPQDITIVAVPDTPESEPMLEFMALHKWPANARLENFCGNELNVLDRYYEAAKFFKLDVIMRITADCPFIVPKVCSEVLQLLIWRKLDYCSNVHPIRSFPKGLDCEAFTFDCLEAAHQLAAIDEQEHVTTWMIKTKELKKALVQQQVDASDINWCVDNPEDIERLEKIMNDKTKKGAVVANDQ